MFDAPDTTSNMQNVYGIYQEQFADLQDKGEVQVNGETKKLRTMLYGDYEASCKRLPHTFSAHVVSDFLTVHFCIER